MSQLHWLESAASTMSVARGDGYGHGDLIATLNQTGGRGRLDRSWVMKPGEGLAMTLVLEWEKLPELASRIPLLAGIALKRVLSEFSPGTEFDLKWPNDLLVLGKKLAGILVEVRNETSVMVGLGINTNATGLGLETATSLSLIGIAIKPEEIAERWRTALLELVADVDDGSFNLLAERSVATVGKTVRVDLPGGEVVRGFAVGIGDDGSLRVEVNGETMTVLAGDVTHLRHETEQQ